MDSLILVQAKATATIRSDAELHPFDILVFCRVSICEDEKRVSLHMGQADYIQFKGKLLKLQAKIPYNPLLKILSIITKY